MKKIKQSVRIIGYIFLAIMVGGISVIYANESKNVINVESPVQYSNEQLIDFLDKGVSIRSDVVSTVKLSDYEKETMIENSMNIDIKDSDVYKIYKQVSDSEMEISVVVAATPNSENQGVESYARVYATALIGYQQINSGGNSYRKGVYYGGYISSQPNSSVITSMKSTYRESGQYILYGATGNYIQTDVWTTSFNHNLANHSIRQTKNVNTGKYFLTNTAGETGIGAILNVSGTTNGYKFSFSANVSGM